MPEVLVRRGTGDRNRVIQVDSGEWAQGAATDRKDSH